MKLRYPLLLCLILSGCAAKSVIHPTIKGQAVVGHSEPVCMLRSPLPSSVPHTVVGKLKSSKKTYGSVSELIPVIAADARAAGADAIINMQTGQRMGMLAWSRPVATGTAVKITDRTSFNCLALGGELR